MDQKAKPVVPKYTPPSSTSTSDDGLECLLQDLEKTYPQKPPTNHGRDLENDRLMSDLLVQYKNYVQALGSLNFAKEVVDEKHRQDKEAVTGKAQDTLGWDSSKQKKDELYAAEKSNVVGSALPSQPVAYAPNILRESLLSMVAVQAIEEVKTLTNERKETLLQSQGDGIQDNEPECGVSANTSESEDSDMDSLYDSDARLDGISSRYDRSSSNYAFENTKKDTPAAAEGSKTADPVAENCPSNQYSQTLMEELSKMPEGFRKMWLSMLSREAVTESTVLLYCRHHAKMEEFQSKQKESHEHCSSRYVDEERADESHGGEKEVEKAEVEKEEVSLHKASCESVKSVDVPCRGWGEPTHDEIDCIKDSWSIPWGNESCGQTCWGRDICMPGRASPGTPKPTLENTTATAYPENNSAPPSTYLHAIPTTNDWAAIAAPISRARSSVPIPAPEPPKPTPYSITYWATIEHGNQEIHIPIDSANVSGPEKSIIEGTSAMKKLWMWMQEKGLNDKVSLQDVYDLAEEMYHDSGNNKKDVKGNGKRVGSPNLKPTFVSWND